MSNDILLAIDANSLIHRAYHAYPLSLTTAYGEPINATYGFATMLLDVLLRLVPKYVVVAFDTKAPTFRHKEYPAYKANRPKTDSELIGQVDSAKKLLKALNIPVLELAGFEADDILGTIVSQVKQDYRRQIKKIVLLTGDKDMLQLVDDFVHVLLPKGSFKNLEEITKEGVVAKLGVLPEQVVDLKALMGDASDNVPGVKGIGAKSAAKLLQQYGTLEKIYAKLEEIRKSSKRLANLLEQGHSDAILSKKLVRIKKDAPIIFSLQDAILKEFNYKDAEELFSYFQFASLMPKLKELAETLGVDTNATNKENPLATKEFTRWAEGVYAFLVSKEAAYSKFKFDDWYKKFFSKASFKRVAVDKLVTILEDLNNLQKKDKTLRKIIFYKDLKNIAALDVADLKLEFANSSKIIFWNWWQFVLDVVEKKEKYIPKIATLQYPIFGPILVAYGLSAGRKDLGFGQIGGAYLNQPAVAVENLEKLDKLKALLFISLSQIEKAQEIIELGKNFWRLVAWTDPKAVLGVAIMQKSGITIDLSKVEQFKVYLGEHLKQLEQQIYKSVGFEFNIRSTQQLGKVLFEVLKLPHGKKTKTGFSTSVGVLEALIEAHPVIRLLLEYRKLQKLFSTYVKPFLQLGKVNKAGIQGTLIDTTQSKNLVRIYSKFDPLRTSTGRLASSEPNLQNLPIRTEEGKKIRDFFVPKKGYIFLALDYSQIDLRVLAHLSEDKALVSAFKAGRDIHRETAAKIFGKKYDDITDSERRIAKTINFGLVYGMGPRGLATRLDIPYEDAQKFINEYFRHFSGVYDYIERTKKFALTHHFVVSLLGRRRYIYGIDSSNKVRQAAALREAVNMPIQGGSDDIIRSAIAKIIELKEILERKAYFVLQIHDELIFEVPDTDSFKENWAKQVQGLMEFAVELRVPLKVGLSLAYSLGEK